MLQDEMEIDRMNSEEAALKDDRAEDCMAEDTVIVDEYLKEDPDAEADEEGNKERMIVDDNERQTDVSEIREG